MKNKSKKRKRSLTLKIFRVKPLWQFALALLASLTLACPGNDGGGNGASPFVCPNGTIQSGTASEANVENCAACNSGFGLAAGGGGMICRPEFVCPNGTAVDDTTSEANVENCTGCNLGFHLTDGENTTQFCRRLTLTNVDNESDTSTLELNNANSVTTAVVGSTTYLFVAGELDSGVSVFSIGSGGALTNVDNVGDGGSLELFGAKSVTTAVIGGTAYLFVAGVFDDGVSVFSVGDNGILTNVDNVDDLSTTVPRAPGVTSELELFNASSVATAVVGSTTYLFVAGKNDDGVSVFSVASNGTLTNVDNEADDGSLELDGATSVTTAVVGSTTYLFVAGFEDDGVSVFSVGSNGTLTNVANVDDNDDVVPSGVGGELELDGAQSVTTAVIGSTTYLFVAGSDDGGVSVFSIGSAGTLTNVANVEDDGDDGTLNLAGAVSVTTAVIGRSTYLFVAGSLDLGVSVFRFGSDGTLTNVANVDDNDSVPVGVVGTLELDGAESVTTAVVGSTTYLFVAGEEDSGVSVFRLGLVAE